MTPPLLEIRDLHVHFPVGAQFLARNKRILHAVSGVDLTLQKGECLSIVGESGCGKSTTALAVMGLQEPTAGDILVDGVSITGEATSMAPTSTSLSGSRPIIRSGTRLFAHSSETWPTRLPFSAGKNASYCRHSVPSVAFQSVFCLIP